MRAPWLRHRLPRARKRLTLLIVLCPQQLSLFFVLVSCIPTCRRSLIADVHTYFVPTKGLPIDPYRSCRIAGRLATVSWILPTAHFRSAQDLARRGAAQRIEDRSYTAGVREEQPVGPVVLEMPLPACNLLMEPHHAHRQTNTRVISFFLFVSGPLRLGRRFRLHLDQQLRRLPH